MQMVIRRSFSGRTCSGEVGTRGSTYIRTKSLSHVHEIDFGPYCKRARNGISYLGRDAVERLRWRMHQGPEGGGWPYQLGVPLT